LSFARTGDRWNPRILVRVPEPDFGGDVDVDWLDAQGQILASRRYQARDTQFFLAPVDKAAQVRVYAADSRTGRSALGSFSLEPPKAVASAAVVKPRLVLPKGPAPKASPPQPSAQPVHPGTPPDTIKQANFDGDPVAIGVAS
jgi:hypothetical protein